MSVCHLLSSCEHASITSKSDSKVFEFSDKFQRCAVVRESGNRRVTPAEKDHDFCFVSVQLEPFKSCCHKICSIGSADFQPCLNEGNMGLCNFAKFCGMILFYKLDWQSNFQMYDCFSIHGGCLLHDVAVAAFTN